VKITKHTHNGIVFKCREGTSDKKTFDEVIVKETYKRKEFEIQKGEHWVDLGGNVGAFTMYAISKGARVDVYEPDPLNCKMIEKNLEANGAKAKVHNLAVISGNEKKLTMYIGNNLQTWRNSLYKNWGNQKIAVDCVHFSKVINRDTLLKMDIEGAEMEILEGMTVFPKKMVFEWSFDIDPDIDRYRAIVEKLKAKYKNVKAPSYDESVKVWPDSWFPPCANVYCW